MDPFKNNLIHIHLQDVPGIMGWLQGEVRKECQEMGISNKGRSCLVTSRVVRGRPECQTSVSGCQVTQGQLSNLGRGSLFGKIGASDFLRDWTMWQVLTQNPFLSLEIIFFSLGEWWRLDNGDLHSHCPQIAAFAHKQPPPSFLLPDCTFYIHISYLSTKNFNENSWHVFEGDFLF